jgi:beta-glucosidase
VTLDSGITVDTWRDPTASTPERVRDLMERMTTSEKIAQLYGVWVGMDAGGEVAPHQHEFTALSVDYDVLIRDGIGQLTRPFGTKPVDPAVGAQGLARSQRQIMAASRFGIPAMVHEECLTGLAAWQATVYPSPLCWGASFDPELVFRMGERIGRLMRSLGVHQGLAPVLDVTRDLRWGRTEETIGEDPFLVGTIGSAYVRGVESAGIVATLKHFVGYSASRAGRNLAPVSIGRRELADILLPPFEMALHAGARSVMASYVDLDGVPVSADPTVLTDLLRDTYGFGGTVVADYFGVSFLRMLHQVAGTPGEAAGLALTAGIDVELPTVDTYGEPLRKAVAAGEVGIELIDRALTRVLSQKCDLGLLDPGWSPEPDALTGQTIDMDDEEARSIARELARESIVLLRNEGVLPLPVGAKVAVVGPRADESSAMMGCYSFPLHVGPNYPDVPMGVRVPTVLEALKADPAGYDVSYAQGVPVLGGDDEGIAAAVRTATDADICVLVLGDLAGLFGAGTSGEGCDATDLKLPGRQAELLDAVLATGTPVVLVLLVGRPYELSTAQVDRLAGAVCGFFLGEEGGTALADVLSGRLNPSGRLPVSFPAAGSNQPTTYLAAPLGRRSAVSNVDPTPVFPFGHGLSYAPATWVGVTSATGEEWATDGCCQIAVTLRNESEIPTAEIVQVYLHDPVAEIARAARQLIGATRVPLAAGETRVVEFDFHADLTSYTGRAGRRQVEPGEVELHVGASSEDIRETVRRTLVGPRREVGFERAMSPGIAVKNG